MHAIEGRNAHENLGAHGFRQLRQDFRRLIRVEIRQHDRDDLRVFVAQDVAHGLGLHPLQRFQAAAAATAQNAIDDAAGLVGSQRLVQYLADVVIGADTE